MKQLIMVSFYLSIVRDRQARNFIDPGAGAEVDGDDGLVSTVTAGLRGMGIAPRTAAVAQPPVDTDTTAAAAPTASRSPFSYMTVNQAMKEGYMYPPEVSHATIREGCKVTYIDICGLLIEHMWPHGRKEDVKTRTDLLCISSALLL